MLGPCIARVTEDSRAVTIGKSDLLATLRLIVNLRAWTSGQSRRPECADVTPRDARVRQSALKIVNRRRGSACNNHPDDGASRNAAVQPLQGIVEAESARSAPTLKTVSPHV
jgi:hypothetical protein